MKNDIGNDLKLVLLPLSAAKAEFANYYKSASQCWRNVWGELYAKHAIDSQVYLDQFLRQDQAACIFHQDVCVAMILFRTADFSILDYAHDSYFKEWTKSDLEVLLKHGTRAFLATYLTVHPEFRNFSPDFKFKEVLLDIMIKCFKISDADVISGVTRRDRGIHDESYKLGARLVHENVEFLGGHFRVDLVAFYRHEARESANLKVRDISAKLWSHRLDLCSPLSETLKAA